MEEQKNRDRIELADKTYEMQGMGISSCNFSILQHEV